MRITAVYYPGWSRGTGSGQTTIANLNWDSFTHVIDFSVGLHNGQVSATWVPDGGGSQVGSGWTPEAATDLCAAADANGRKAVLCLGNEHTSESFAANTDTVAKREAIAEQLADMMVTHGYHGVDFDGEPANSTAIPNYQALIVAVRDEFAARGWRTAGAENYRTLSLVCFGSEVDVAKQAIVNGCDWVGPMLYTPWENTARHVSPIRGDTTAPNYQGAWHNQLSQWTEGANPIPRDKLLMGWSYHARRWDGVSGPNQAGTQNHQGWGWSFLLANGVTSVEGGGATWYGGTPAGTVTTGPCSAGRTISGNWYSFDTAPAVRAKQLYIEEENLGGSFVWMYQFGSTGGANNPIADVVAAEMVAKAGSGNGGSEGSAYVGMTRTVVYASSAAAQMPSGVEPGDRVLFTVRANWEQVQTPAGLTLVRADFQGTTTYNYLFERVIAGNEPSSYTFSIESAQWLSIYTHAFRGVDRATDGFVGNGGATSSPVPTLTTQDGDYHLVSAYVNLPDTDLDIVPLGGLTIVGERTAADNAGQVTGYEVVPAGTTPSRTVTSATAGDLSAYAVLLRPQSDPDPPSDGDPANLTSTQVAGGLRLTCGPSPTPGVTGYRWFRRTPPTGQPFDPGTDSALADTSGTEHVDGTVAVGTEYEFQVFGKVGGGG